VAKAGGRIDKMKYFSFLASKKLSTIPLEPDPKGFAITK